MIEWTRPSGSKITTNDRKETISSCESMGWNRADKEEPKQKRKVKRGNSSESNQSVASADSGSGL